MSIHSDRILRMRETQRIYKLTGHEQVTGGFVSRKDMITSIARGLNCGTAEVVARLMRNETIDTGHAKYRVLPVV